MGIEQLTLVATLTGEDGGSPGAPVGLWEADEGLVASGTNLVSWTDSVNGLQFTPTDAPAQVITGPAGTPMVRFLSGTGMVIPGIGSLPEGAEDRQIAVCFRNVTDGRYALFTCGTATQGLAFGMTIVPAQDGDRIAVDLYGTWFEGPLVEGQGVVAIATLTGGFFTLDVNGLNVIPSTAITVNSGNTHTNLCRSFSGNTTQCDVGAVRVNDAANILDEAGKTQLVNFWRAKYLTPPDAPVITNQSLGTPTETSLVASFTSDRDGGADFVVLVHGSAAPTQQQVLNAQDGDGQPAAYANIGFGMTAGANNQICTNLLINTSYDLHGYAYADGVPIYFANTVGVSTLTGGAPAPSISGNTVKSASSGYVSTVATNTGNGTMYILNRTASGTPSEELVLGGDSFPITSSGSKVLSGSGLAPVTTYYSWAVHVNNEGRASAVTSLGTFTTDPVSGGGGGQYENVNASVSNPVTNAKVNAAINAVNDIGGTYVIALEGNPTEDITVTGYTFNNTKVVIRPKYQVGGYTVNKVVQMGGLANYYTYSYPSEFNNLLKFSECKGIWWFRFPFNGLRKCRAWGSLLNCGFEECHWQGNSYNLTNGGADGPNSGAKVFAPGRDGNDALAKVNGLHLLNCSGQWGAATFVEWTWPTDCKMEGFVSVWTLGDTFKIVGNSVRYQSINNYGTYQTYLSPGTAGAHNDYIQLGGDKTHTDMVWRGDVNVKGWDTWTEYKSHQGLYWPGGLNDGFIVEQNLTCHSTIQSGSNCSAPQSGSRVVRYNEQTHIKAINITFNNYPERLVGLTQDYGFSAGKAGRGQVGANGLFDGTVATSTDGADYNHQKLVDNGHFTEVVTMQSFDLYGLKAPNTGTRRHPNHSNPVGPYLTQARLFHDFEVPRNGIHGMIWEDQYNRNGRIIAKFDGALDGWGNRA